MQAKAEGNLAKISTYFCKNAKLYYWPKQFWKVAFPCQMNIDVCLSNWHGHFAEHAFMTPSQIGAKLPTVKIIIVYEMRCSPMPKAVRMNLRIQNCQMLLYDSSDLAFCYWEAQPILCLLYTSPSPRDRG